MDESKPVIIVGGGWAGLAAAVKLSSQGIPVTLLESAKQFGGRARRSAFKPNVVLDKGIDSNHLAVDNGQHILIGAYRSTLSLLKTIGVSERKLFRRHALYMHMLKQQEKPLRLKVGRLPAPIHLITGLLTATGLSRADKISALRFSRELARIHYQLKQDVSCKDLFEAHQQSERLVSAIWEPLCLAALNTQISEASAQLFLYTIRDSFSVNRSDSDYLFPRHDLGSVFPEPAIDYIERQGGHVRLAARVEQLHFQDNQLVGVSLEDERIDTRHAILATSFSGSCRLMRGHPLLDPLCDDLSKLQTNPICTVYLHYPERVSMGREITGFLSSVSQWAIDRSLCGNPGLIGVVISADGQHMALNNEQLAQRVIEEMAAFFPKWPKPVDCMVVREKNATFKSTVQSNQLRPDNKTPVNGLYLAGDYTHTGLPATLEGSLRSGLRSAELLAQQLSRESNSRHFD